MDIRQPCLDPGNRCRSAANRALVYRYVPNLPGGTGGERGRVESGRESPLFVRLRGRVSNFWRVLGYFLLLVLISLGLLLAFGIPLALLVTVVFAGTEATGARRLTVVLAALVGFVLLLVVFVPLIVVWQLGLREVVLRREGVTGSIGSGYHLFRRNLGKSLLLLVIQIAISIRAGVALLIATLLLGLLLAAPALILFAADLDAAGIVAGIVAGLILLPLLLVASGALGAFNHSYLTPVYLRLTGVPGVHLPHSGAGT